MRRQVAVEGRQCGERAPEAGSVRREQQVLYRREDRRGERGFDAAGRVAGDHDEDRRVAHSAGGAPVDLGEQARGESVAENSRPAFAHAPAVTSPIRARVSGSRTTTNTHGWEFSALGAWVAALEELLEQTRRRPVRR